MSHETCEVCATRQVCVFIARVQSGCGAGGTVMERTMRRANDVGRGVSRAMVRLRLFGEYIHCSCRRPPIITNINAYRY